MKVLFYIEPLIERESPFWKRGWIDHYGNKIANQLEAEGVAQDEILFIVPSSLRSFAEVNLSKYRICDIDQNELIPKFGKSALDVSSHWYKNTYSSDQLESMATLVQKKVFPFVPDLVISFSPAPFFKPLWDGVRLLNIECGFLSRHPFPETIYFDPFGMFEKSALVNAFSQLEKKEQASFNPRILETIRSAYNPTDEEHSNPITQFLKPLLVRFDVSILLALQFSGFYAYDANAQFTDQYDLLVHTLEKTPENIAVIVCEHPDHYILEPEIIRYLREKYPHFVWCPEFRSIYAVSHHIMPFVDGVVTVTSSVGIQALLWKKKLAILGGGHLRCLADTAKVSEFAKILHEPYDRKKDQLL